jgi:hypothetical protein
MKYIPSDNERRMQNLVLSEALRNAIPNTLLFGAVALGTLYLGAHWPLLGKIVCVLYGLLLGFEVIRHSSSLISILAVCLFHSAQGQGKMLVALSVQIAETAAFAFFFWLLLRRFFLS